MIVVCPSCQQRYRHAATFAGVPPTARCSACDESFELSAPKRSYVMIAPGGPQLAPQERAVIAPPRFDMDLPTDGSPALVPDLTAPFDSEVGVAPESVAASSAAALPARHGDRATSDQAAGPARTRPWVESLVALVPGGLGGAIGYHAAGPPGEDALTWAMMGAAVGLLVGWVWLLWITRAD